MNFWNRIINRILPLRRNRVRVRVYTRPNCLLCDEAFHLLRRHGLRPLAVNIDADPELRTRFDLLVPVVEIEGRIRFRGRVNEVLLRRLLRHL